MEMFLNFFMNNTMEQISIKIYFMQQNKIFSNYLQLLKTVISKTFINFTL